MRFSVYPWDLKSWRSAFRIAGLPGIALFMLFWARCFRLQILQVGGPDIASPS